MKITVGRTLHRDPSIERALLAAVLLVAPAAPVAAAGQPSLVGEWSWTRKANNCAETYAFRNNGTVSIKTGDETIERSYLMAWAPEPNGRYTVTMTTVKDSGGQGCADTVDGNTARSPTVHILFGGSGASMLICNSPAGADCIGPLKRNGQ
ncbi:MAG TPA: hypothetical protein VMG60_18740 [Burkholderiaceae bacterium]|nr:hypothetical protein [Burkholderiaceae bacterium]